MSINHLHAIVAQKTRNTGIFLKRTFNNLITVFSLLSTPGDLFFSGPFKGEGEGLIGEGGGYLFLEKIM